MLLGLLLSGCGRQTESYLEASPQEETSSLESTQEGVVEPIPDDEPILVYVCGEVVSPGVYELTSGMHICDAVDAAGGLTDKASRSYWNLAERLSDGQMLYFPTEEEAKERSDSASEAGAAAEETDTGRININTADASQLMQIPGIGESRADAILAYRREYGVFSSVEDIMKVSGIKNALFEKMKDYITI
jgi:competence protein ComEA